ncbi:MAG: mannosyltransferase family protein, partial [Proteobacteria bacterium]|nr:mannosyltransferase family protein [Pseudomonadota bacterium]
NLNVTFVILTLIGLTLRSSFSRYYYELNTFYDVGNYTKIAEFGYESVGISAFHPLWPMLVRFFASILQINGQPNYGLLAGILSFVCFLFSVKILSPILIRVGGQLYGIMALWLFVLNPTSIFHVTGFSESLCCLLFAFLINELLEKRRVYMLIGLSALISFARPVAYFLPLAALLAWPIANFAGKKPLRSSASECLSLVGGALGAFVVLSGYFYFQLGDFFANSKTHDMWGRKFGFYWQLIYSPKSVGGSEQVLMWDLIGFYLPLFLVAFSGFKLFGSAEERAKYSSCLEDPIYWLCLLLSAAHCGAAFLSYPIFASTARHVMAIPCIFYCSARIFKAWKPNPRILVALVIISAVFYLRWWARFGKGSWIG